MFQSWSMFLHEIIQGQKFKYVINIQRRDQLMWNTLSIQYNSLIEEEFDEHYRVTCEYGSDFWKTVTFPAVNVE